MKRLILSVVLVGLLSGCQPSPIDQKRRAVEDWKTEQEFKIMEANKVLMNLPTPPAKQQSDEDRKAAETAKRIRAIGAAGQP